MRAAGLVTWILRAYVCLALLFVFAPIITSFIYSFDASRYAAFPWGGFSTQWYGEALADPAVASSFRNTVIVALLSASLATAIGFAAAYTDYRYKFFGKNAYLALALLPPTIPAIILGLAMLVFLSRVSLSGGLHSIIISHVVYAIPFAMALVRLRLSQMPADLEAVAWNLGAGQWLTLRSVILPFTLPAILAALFLTMAVSFDEYAIAWFVSGFSETLPVHILILLQREVSPKVNVIGSVAFIISMTLIVVAQIILFARAPAKTRGRSFKTGS
ncbi:MAG: ABC transporter permease [Rhodospirillaceae bacterium]|nr:MAG: ABC transporter permease [Rhodospirillaceae bacterium]